MIDEKGNKYTMQVICSIVSVVVCVVTKIFVYKRDIFEVLNWLILGVALSFIAVRDYRERIIPNVYLIRTLICAIVLLIVQLVFKHEYWVAITGSRISGVLIGGGIFFLAALISKNGIGGGDVKMYAVLGMIVGGSATFNILLLALTFGMIVSIIGLLIGKLKKNDQLPLAPYTYTAFIVAMLLGV